MKIVLSTFGSRGDVQPMLALSLGLQAAGHEVLLIGPPEKATWAAELGCPYQAAGSDVTALIDTMDAAHTARSALIFMRYVRREIAVQFEALPSMVRGADIIVAASLCFGLASMAEAMQISYRFIAVQICTEKKSYRQKARLVGQEIRRGDGVQQTIQAIFASH